MRLSLWAAAAVVASLAGVAALAQEKKAEPSPRVQEMVDLADKGFAECVAEKRYGLGHADEVTRWSARRVAAARLTGDPARIKAALEAHVADMKKLEDHSKTRLAAGDAVELEVLAASYERAQAELELEKFTQH
jgi:hypothetical protein